MGDELADIATDYQRSLDDLKENSKLHINVLTMLAEDYIKHAPVIVRTIIDHVDATPPETKLAVLYLIDSIIKNVGQAYFKLFSQHIVSIFTSVFQKVDERTRAQMYKLRVTWNTVFPNKILYALDLQTKEIDPAWPINATPSSSIHINPKFLGTPAATAAILSSTQGLQSSPNETEILKAQQQEVLKQLLDKQNHLRLLETKKLMLAAANPVTQAVPTAPQLLDKQNQLRLLEPKSTILAAANQVNQPVNTAPQVTVQRDPRIANVTTPRLSNDPRLLNSAARTQTAEQRIPKSDPRISKADPRLLKTDPRLVKAAASKISTSSPPHSSSPSSKSTTTVASVISVVKNKSEEHKPSPKISLSKHKDDKNEKTSVIPKSSDKKEIHSDEKKLENVVNVEKQEIQSSQNKIDDNYKHNTERLNTVSKDNKKHESSPNEKKNSPKSKSNTLQKTESSIHKDKDEKSTKKKKKSDDLSSPDSSKQIGKKSSPKRSKEKKSFRFPRNQSDEKKYPRHRSRSPVFKNDKKSPKNYSTRESHSRKPSLDHTKRKLNLSSRTDKESDEDLRRFSVSEDERHNKDGSGDGEKENLYEPPEKRSKGEKSKTIEDSLFGTEDQDYRQLSKKDSYEGWAMYKKAHPDEFKTPPRSISRDSIDNGQSSFDDYGNSNDKTMSKSPLESSNFNQLEYDRLGRPRLSSMRQLSDSFYPFPKRENSFDESNSSNRYLQDILRSDPKGILQQVEEKYRRGTISKAVYDDIQRDLEDMSKMKEKSRGDPSNQMNFGNHMNYFKHKEFNQLQPYRGMKVQGPHKPLPDTSTFELDKKLRKILFIDDKAFVLMDDGQFRQLIFQGNPTPVFVEGLKPITLMFDGSSVDFELDGEFHTMRFGTPSRELYIDNYPYEGKFGGPPFLAMLGNGRIYRISLGGPPPIVRVNEHPTMLPEERNMLLSKHNKTCDIDMRMLGNANDREWAPHETRSDKLPADGRAALYKSAPYSFKPGYEDKNFLERHDHPFPKDHPDHLNWESSSHLQPPGSEPPIMRHHDWKHPQFRDLQMANSPQTTPPREPPESEDWTPQNSSRPFNSEPPNRPWLGRNFGPGGPRPNLPRPDMYNTHNVPPHQNQNEFYGESINQPPNFRPMRPPFNPRMPRPPFSNDQGNRARLPPPPELPFSLQRWRQPSEKPRYAALLPPPPRPPIRLILGDSLKKPNQPKVLLPNPPVPPILNPPANSSQLTTDAPAETPSTDAAPLVKNEPVSPPPAQTLDINSLFEKLLSAGIISKPVSENTEVLGKQDEEMKDEKKEESDKKEDKEIESIEEEIPPIDLKLECLKKSQLGVVAALYRGSQCASCGMRFKEIHGERYSRHLDWHFRMNRREKDGVKKAFSRKWYYEVEDWIQFEEFEDFEERARSFFELQADQLYQIEPTTEVPSIPACSQETELCIVCGEPFHLFWVEEEEEWHLRNAVRHEGQPYHPSCYEDYIKVFQEPEPVKKEPESDDLIAQAEIISEETIQQEVEEIVGLLVYITVEEEEYLKELKIKEELLQGHPGEEEIIGLISESEMESDHQLEEESEKVILESGGIIMKVRADSVKPASPITETSAENDSDAKKQEGENDFRPPTPDPRFTVIPPVLRGEEMSGLCCIM